MHAGFVSGWSGVGSGQVTARWWGSWSGDRADHLLRLVQELRGELRRVQTDQLLHTAQILALQQAVRARSAR